MADDEDRLPEVVPPVRSEHSPLNRHLPPSEAIGWLRAGWRDFTGVNMQASLIYGVFVFLVSVVFLGLLIRFRADYITFPALGAFTVFGPVLAVGLYEKSRRIAAGEPVRLRNMLRVRSRSGGQLPFIGVLLVLLVMLWLRVAVLLYALFFGMRPIPELDEVVGILLTTSPGLGLLLVGSLFGALFAGLAFGIGALSVPMLLNERSDAFSAMGASIALVWNNLPVMLTWGAIVMLVFVGCLLTGLLGLIVAFPVLGHATWHAYVAVRGEPESPIQVPAIPDAA